MSAHIDILYLRSILMDSNHRITDIYINWSVVLNLNTIALFNINAPKMQNFHSLFI